MSETGLHQGSLGSLSFPQCPDFHTPSGGPAHPVTKHPLLFRLVGARSKYLLPWALVGAPSQILGTPSQMWLLPAIIVSLGTLLCGAVPPCSPKARSLSSSLAARTSCPKPRGQAQQFLSMPCFPRQVPRVSPLEPVRAAERAKEVARKYSPSRAHFVAGACLCRAGPFSDPLIALTLPRATRVGYSPRCKKQ